MSKIGRKPIDLGDVSVEVKGQEIHYKGKRGAGVHVLPPYLQAVIEGKQLKLVLKDKADGSNMAWGMHRALVANEIKGVQTGFEKQIQINGLGYKAAITGNKLDLTLGYSHKISYDLPAGVTVDIDKTGQLLTVKSSSKEIVGHVCSVVRSFRPPEPYKGTGIKLATEVIARKAGKAKSAA